MTDTPKTRALTRSEVLRALETLPTLPSVVAELLSLDWSRDDSLDRVRELAELEPALASRVLILVNSAAYAPMVEIVDIDQAVTRLGANTVSDLIMTFAVLRVFVPATNAQRNLWRHSILVATLARELAGATSWGVDPTGCYTLGLLHDIGRLVMFANDPAHLNEVDGRLWHSPAELLELEASICGYDHTEVGRRVCSAWNLPLPIVDVVKRHHDPVAQTPASAIDRDIAIIQQGDIWACVLAKHAQADDTDSEEWAARLEDTTLPAVAAALTDEVDHLIKKSLDAQQRQAEALHI